MQLIRESHKHVNLSLEQPYNKFLPRHIVEDIRHSLFGMPPLKNKTNLPSVDRRTAVEPSDPPNKKKPYSQMVKVASDKGQLRAMTAKAAGGHGQGKGKKDIAVAIGKRTKQSGTAKRQLEVEVIIPRSASSIPLNEAEKDELASDSDVHDHIGGTTVAGKFPSRSANAEVDVIPGSDEEAGSQTRQIMFWERGEEESLDDMLENLLPKDTEKAVKEKGNVTKKEPSMQAPFGNSIGKQPINASNPKNKKSALGERSGATVSLATESRTTPLATEQPAIIGTPSLEHAIVIKVLEHALKKNIDWFTMSKELEAQGFKDGKVIAKGKRKGKRGNVDADDGEESDSNTARQKPGVRMDGNSLCKSCF